MADNCCTSRTTPDCVADDPALGFNMYRSVYGIGLLVFLFFAVIAGLKQVTGASGMLDLFRFFFRGLFAAFLKGTGRVADFTGVATEKRDTAAELFMYAAGFGVMVTFNFYRTASGAGTGAVLLITLFSFYLTTTIWRNAFPAQRAVQRAAGSNSGTGVPLMISPDGQSIIIPAGAFQQGGVSGLPAIAGATPAVAAPAPGSQEVIRAVNSFCGGLALGFLVLVVSNLVRFFTVRSYNAVADSLYVVSGVGVGVFLITYYGSTLRARRRAGPRGPTLIDGADGQQYEVVGN